jgi:hypothetical protein
MATVAAGNPAGIARVMLELSPLVRQVVPMCSAQPEPAGVGGRLGIHAVDCWPVFFL